MIPPSRRTTAREGLDEEGKEDKGEKDQEDRQRPTEGRWESIDDVVTDGGEHQNEEGSRIEREIHEKSAGPHER